MSESISKNSLPGMSEGSATTGIVEQKPAPGPTGGQIPVAAPAPPAAFGGNPTGRTRKDGLKPGSPEAIEADKKYNRERMAAKRATEKSTALPPALPASTAATSAVLSSPGQTSIPVVDGAQDVAPMDWLPDDFKQVAPDTLDLLEQWRIADKVSLAEEGKLSGPVIKQIEKDAAFPATAKRSLQSSSPAALAKLFNALHVPIALKSYITTCPTLLYLMVRDMQQRSEIRKLILSEAERSRTPEAPEKKP
jgi:hypothetical protein